jgi:hypothetical protein
METLDSAQTSKAKQAAERLGKTFLQGLKPIGCERHAPGLKPRPPKESEFFRKL